MQTETTRVQDILLLCGLGAVARYLFKEGPLSLRLFVANLILASFIGVSATFVAEWYGWPTAKIGAIAGILSYLGPTTITAYLKGFLRFSSNRDDTSSTKDESKKGANE